MTWPRKYALNRFDLIGGVCAFWVITVLGILAEWHFAVPPFSNKPLYSAIIASWGAILLAGVGGAVKITTTRQSLNRLFSSEIRAFQYGLHVMDMFDFWKQVYERPEGGEIGFADTPRKEDYFDTFRAVSGNIGNLHPHAVEAIVRFYIYLKMSRDAAAVLHSWSKKEDSALRRLDVKYVVKLLTVSMLWGFVALWSMGAECLLQDDDLRKQMEKSYDTVCGEGKFAELCKEPIWNAQLKAFKKSLN